MTKIHDISPPIAPETAVWPGDMPFSRSGSLHVDQGHSVTLSSIATTLHIGAHADAPSHYTSAGSAIDAVSLEPYWGPCLVWSVPQATAIQPEHCPQRLEPGITRVLFQTGTMPDWRKFPVQFAFFAPESVAHLAGLGVQLIGIDTPSVDAFDSKTLPTHHALLKFNMRNLEGLWLQDILPGVYELCALPLRLSGADASPVRAVLRELI